MAGWSFPEERPGEAVGGKSTTSIAMDTPQVRVSWRDVEGCLAQCGRVRI